MKQIGSQMREPLNESGHVFVERRGPEVILYDGENYSLWVARDDFAGYVIEIDGVGCEFISTLTTYEP
jgi:hypothetical protein